MVLRLLWKSLLALLLFEFREAYLLALLAGLSLVYDMEEVTEEGAEEEAGENDD
jgi:hypothetical protein